VIRIGLVFLMLCAGCDCAMAKTDASVDQAALQSLATTYSFGVAETASAGCVVRLKAVRGKVRRGFPLSINARCRQRFPILRTVSRWEPTGGGSLRLLGGSPFHELSDFAPVQDGSGVYLRGGFAGDRHVYELRPPQ